jgi:hypothetical protein
VAIGDGHSGEGKTLYTWDRDVERIVQRVLSRFSAVTVNTYECHPFCGWERRSLDVWGPAGRGDPIGRDLSLSVLQFLWDLPGEPLIRHYILGHKIWVRGVGAYRWPADDHIGSLRHLHVTYMPVPSST